VAQPYWENLTFNIHADEYTPAGKHCGDSSHFWVRVNISGKKAVGKLPPMPHPSPAVTITTQLIAET
jgi:hypothetical protein